jgi:hypothetical protein
MRTGTKEGGTEPVKGGHIGKRNKRIENVVRTSYASLEDDLKAKKKEKKKQARKERLKAMDYDA